MNKDINFTEIDTHVRAQALAFLPANPTRKDIVAAISFSIKTALTEYHEQLNKN